MAQNVALVLSSGGARGIAHIGVIQELIKSGYTITSVAGTSMGSLIGGMLAKGTLTEFTEWLLSFSKMDMLKFMDLTTSHGGLIKGEKIVKVLGDFVGNSLIEDLSIPFVCVASDLIGNKEVVFNKGSLLEAIRASSSIPTVFLPVASEGMMLVDGGVLNPLPLDLVQRTNGDILIAVNVNANIPYESPKPVLELEDREKNFGKVRTAINEKWSEIMDQYTEKYNNGHKEKPKIATLFDVVSQSINMTQNKLAAISIEKYQPEILIDVSHNMATIFDFYRSEELIEAGRIACRKALDEAGKTI